MQNFSPFVSGNTADKRSFANISANFKKKFETILMGYSVAWGKLLHEKNFELKILCQTPFKASFKNLTISFPGVGTLTCTVYCVQPSHATVPLNIFLSLYSVMYCTDPQQSYSRILIRDRVKKGSGSGYTSKSCRSTNWF